jgi:hypothetical protein
MSQPYIPQPSSPQPSNQEAPNQEPSDPFHDSHKSFDDWKQEDPVPRWELAVTLDGQEYSRHAFEQSLYDHGIHPSIHDRVRDRLEDEYSKCLQLQADESHTGQSGQRGSVFGPDPNTVDPKGELLLTS